MDNLLEIIDTKILPWARDSQRHRIIATGAALRKADLPEGVLVTKKLPRGPRLIQYERRVFSDPNKVTAKWQRDGLVETAGVPHIVCVFGGRVDFWAGDGIIHCGDGHFLLLPSGIRHDNGKKPHYHPSPKAPHADDFCDLLWIERRGRIIRTWTCHSEGAIHGSRAGTQADFLNDIANGLLDLLMAEALAGQEDWRAVCRDCLCGLLTILRRELNLGVMLTSIHHDELESGAQPRGDAIEDARKFIQTHLREQLTIETVARHVGMSRAPFTKRFRQQSGQTFSQYLTQCRIEEAKNLLVATTWSVRRLSGLVGLKSATYFCRLFAQQVGVSPQAFRNRQNGVSHDSRASSQE